MTDEKTDKEKRDFNRRTFIGAVAAVGAGAVLASCKKSYPPVTFVDAAPDGPVLKAGLIGCGNRGTGAALNFLKAGPNLENRGAGRRPQGPPGRLAAKSLPRRLRCRWPTTIALSDSTLTRKCSTPMWTWCCWPPRRISGRRISMPRWTPRNTFFLEKPCAVDAPGVRSILATGQKAAAYNLCLVSGTLWRHDRPHRETYNRVSHGAIGQILGARSRYNVGQLWYAPKKKEWSDMEAMIRDWVNWRWLSGDHIVEQCRS